MKLPPLPPYRVREHARARRVRLRVSPAHGIEMTFSEGNQFVRNRLVENAICGVWGGYSSGTLIAENEFTGNGGMAYGLERGAINMEHAADNLIVKNRFLNNKCAVHLWWDNDGALLKYPGVAGTEKGIVGNVIAGNRFAFGSSRRNASQRSTAYWRSRNGMNGSGRDWCSTDLRSTIPRGGPWSARRAINSEAFSPSFGETVFNSSPPFSNTAMAASIGAEPRRARGLTISSARLPAMAGGNDVFRSD